MLECEEVDIQIGDIFIAADGGHYGYWVTDPTSFACCGDVVVTPFTETHGLDTAKAGSRIDKFKLTRVRYYKPSIVPEWATSAIMRR